MSDKSAKGRRIFIKINANMSAAELTSGTVTAASQQCMTNWPDKSKDSWSLVHLGSHGLKGSVLVEHFCAREVIQQGVATGAVPAIDSPRCSESDRVGHSTANAMSVRAGEKKKNNDKLRNMSRQAEGGARFCKVRKHLGSLRCRGSNVALLSGRDQDGQDQ